MASPHDELVAEDLIRFDPDDGTDEENEDSLPSDDNEQPTAFEFPGPSICKGCGKASHLRRRWIICADGTWMVADGVIGSPLGNCTNVARIWMMVEEGVVKKEDEDETSKQVEQPWEQRRVLLDGIGAVEDWPEKARGAYDGRGPTGYEAKIKEIYKICCVDVCNAEDEVFLFGFSRGAFAIRAVVGMLHHLDAIKHDARDFDSTFDEALKLYRGAQNQSGDWKARVKIFLDAKTKKAPHIKFVGLFDTVKAVNDANLNDIGRFEKVKHVRHALALFEKRKVFHVQHLSPTESRNKNSTSQEAWFAGSHGNIGGSCKQDGLALWPLHWIVTEAQRNGLVLGFRRHELSSMTDPSLLIFPEKSPARIDITCRNGIPVSMHDLTCIMNKFGSIPRIDGGTWPIPRSNADRAIFKNNKLVGLEENAPTGTFIHPSVFYLDQTDHDIIQFIDRTPYGKLLREQEAFTISDPSQVFWTLKKEMEFKRHAEKPRILLCGPTGSGKSSLINRILGRDLSAAQEHDPGVHNIYKPLEIPEGPLIFHDSQGFSSQGSTRSQESNYEFFARFLTECRAEHKFKNQIHCIWYVVSIMSNRIQEADQDFRGCDFGGAPVLLVLTHLDMQRIWAKNQAVKDYANAHPKDMIRNIGHIPRAQRSAVERHGDEIYQKEIVRKRKVWNTAFGENPFSNTLFISTDQQDDHLVPMLVDESQTAMSNDRIARIHAHAQFGFIDDTANTVIAALAASSLNDKLSVEVALRAYVHASIPEVATIFEFEGVPMIHLISIIEAHLWPARFPNHGFLGPFARSVAPGVIVAAGWSLVGFLWLSFLIFSYLAIVLFIEPSEIPQNMANIDMLLVLERIFWYGGHEIDEITIRAGCLYYLKRRPEVHARLKKMRQNNVMSKELARAFQRSGHTPTASSQALRDLFEEFRYRARTVSVETIG